jgi:hypothetical protein
MTLVRLAAIGALALGVACARRPEPGLPPAPGQGVAPIGAPAPRLTWQLKTREHVDLWLHGYALLNSDSALVPLFRREWRDESTVLKNQREVITALDTALQTLRFGLKRNPALAQGQFVAQQFASLPELQAGIAALLSSDGDPRRAGDRRALVAGLAQVFATPADRAWLRLFAQGLQDEYDRWFHQWWVEQQRVRAPVIQAANSLWLGGVRDQIAPYLKEARILDGEAILSLPLGGEGRLMALSPNRVSAAVTFPAEPSRAVEVVYGLVHEVVGVLAGQVVADNTTPAEKRVGAADRLTAVAAVRAGALLLKLKAPALQRGYEAWYLQLAGAKPGVPFDQAFPLPSAIETALGRQLELLLGGI